MNVHLTKGAAHRAASAKTLAARGSGRSSGWGRVEYGVRPFLRVLWRVVPR